MTGPPSWCRNTIELSDRTTTKTHEPMFVYLNLRKIVISGGASEVNVNFLLTDNEKKSSLGSVDVCIAKSKEDASLLCGNSDQAL